MRQGAAKGCAFTISKRKVNFLGQPKHYCLQDSHASQPCHSFLSQSTDSHKDREMWSMAGICSLGLKESTSFLSAPRSPLATKLFAAGTGLLY